MFDHEQQTVVYLHHGLGFYRKMVHKNRVTSPMVVLRINRQPDFPEKGIVALRPPITRGLPFRSRPYFQYASMLSRSPLRVMNNLSEPPTTKNWKDYLLDLGSTYGQG